MPRRCRRSRRAGDEQVPLTPEHRLRSAGGATGARDVQIVGRRRIEGEGPALAHDALVVDRTRERRAVAAVVDFDQEIELVEDLAQLGRQRAFVDDATRAEHAEQVGDLRGRVLVVDVARHRPGLPAGEDCLEVLGAVVHEHGDAVLAALPGPERVAFPVRADPTLVEVGGDRVARTANSP